MASFARVEPVGATRCASNTAVELSAGGGVDAGGVGGGTA